MRNNDGFIAGMVTGAAVGALIVMAMSPDIRRPMMRSANQMGDRMRKMVNRSTDNMEDMVPEDVF